MAVATTPRLTARATVQAMAAAKKATSDARATPTVAATSSKTGTQAARAATSSAAAIMQVQGVAATDFHERDFYSMKRWHQLGNIAQAQRALILKKLVEVHRMKGGKPEMLVSLSDFEFVEKLPRTKNKLEYESE